MIDLVAGLFYRCRKKDGNINKGFVYWSLVQAKHQANSYLIITVGVWMTKNC